MTNSGIKRLLGESNLERKIQFLFTVCLLLLVAGSFLWVNRITEDLIESNSKARANGLLSDFIFRTHFNSLETFFEETLSQDQLTDKQEATAFVFELLTREPSTIPYAAEIFALDRDIGRTQIAAGLSRDPDELQRLESLVPITKKWQKIQNDLEVVRRTDPSDFENQLKITEQQPAPDDDQMIEDTVFITSKKYYYYAPLIFKSESTCIFCHSPQARDPGQDAQLTALNDLLAQPDLSDVDEKQYMQDKLDMANPMFVRFELDNSISRSVITRSRAILISVAIVTAVLSVGMVWTIVRYVIVKPLAHLRNVTEEVGKGDFDVRADLQTGDEFEELSRSFNRMLIHVVDSQSALQEANQVLDRKVDEQAQLNLQLHEMNQLKSEFLANMSHELRTPLNSIIGFSELLESGKGLDDKQRRFAANICKSGHLLLDLINDILDLAKLEAGKMEVRVSEFSITRMIAELCELVMHLAKAKNIRLDFPEQDDWPAMQQDKVKVRQILTNLLSNAIKFTPEGGRITVSVERDETGPAPRLKLRVQDTGIGIAPDDQTIVFQKFRQGPSALGEDALTRQVSGTGLGLSIVKELCILLGGSVQLESEVGRGSLFTVELPWVFQQELRKPSEISGAIDEITKSHRVDFGRTNQTPVPPSQDEV